MGNYFWNSRLKIEPMAFAVLGLEFAISKLYFRLTNSIGYFISTFILYNKDDFFLYTFTSDLFNRVDLLFRYQLSSRFGLVVMWSNKFNFYSDISFYITSFTLFQNSFFVGLEYEL